MLNRLKPACRFLWRRKSFSFLNIFGLSMGIAASLLIFLLIRNEFSFDTYHRHARQTFRVVTEITRRGTGEVLDRNRGVPIPFATAMRQEFPQVKTGFVSQVGQAQIYVPGKNGSDEKRFKENEGLYWADAELFELFDVTWIEGNARRLREPNTVVMEESFAKRFFGSVPAAMGQQVQLWSFRVPLQVVGVYKDLPGNTDLPLYFAGSMETMYNLVRKRNGAMEDWERTSARGLCFIQLPVNVKPASIESRMPGFVRKYYPQGEENDRRLLLQPLLSMHLDPDYTTYIDNRLSKKELWALGLIGTFLLLVACINFINLSTAQSVNRSREIGVRKVLGSGRAQLIRQFLLETAIITLFALILGVILTYAAIPLINNLMGKDLSLDLLTQPGIALFLLLTGVIVTLLAGFYPALVLSGFKPAQIFKSKANGRASSGIYLRRGLVVFQFVIAQLLIIGTVVVVRQMNFFREQSTGIDKDNIVLINLPSDSSLQVRYPLLRERIGRIPGVQATSLCHDAPAGYGQFTEDVYYGNETAKRDFMVTRQLADTGYYRTFGIRLAEGRLPFHSDSTVELVVNQTLVKKLGIRNNQEVIGKQLGFDPEPRYTIVGVIKDFNNLSLRDPLTPLAISSEFDYYEWIAVRLSGEGQGSILQQVRKTFADVYPTYMYDQIYFDERLGRFYENEAVTSQLFKLFAAISILISCLGLYGLISFMAVQKTKEVGIRKVLGASVQSIVYLFSREFTLLIGVAFVIASPLGYYLMSAWLGGFYYHVDLGWVVFLTAIGSTLVIAWMTVGYRAFRAAVVSPVKSLKTE